MDGKPQVVILCYGKDPMLLLTREQIFKRAGIPVVTTTTQTDFRIQVCWAKPELILLCHSLSTEECMDAASFVKESCPESKVLLMYSLPGVCDLQDEHAVFFSMDGPAALLRAVQKLVPVRAADESQVAVK